MFDDVETGRNTVDVDFYNVDVDDYKYHRIYLVMIVVVLEVMIFMAMVVAIVVTMAVVMVVRMGVALAVVGNHHAIIHAMHSLFFYRTKVYKNMEAQNPSNLGIIYE